MMANDHNTPLPVASTAGAQLRAAREAAGWSQEAVAQQLKLAPRQVRAIEEDDYARLPGRTFVRGFVRNYARLVRLDPSAVMAALPRGDGTSPLDRPSLTAVSRPMVELPVASMRRNPWTRWLIPFALLAIVAAAGVYEFMRSPAASRRIPVESGSVTPSPPPASQGPSTTALPNPLANAKTESAGPMAQSESATAGAPPIASDTSTAESVAPTPAAPTPNAAAQSATLLLTFKEKSWVEVKDGNGAAIFLQTGAAGTTQTLSGTPPLDVSIGNAAGVTLTYRGQPIDIAPYTRANIARLLLK
jgi:cytoskeleton protein RodZ